MNKKMSYYKTNSWIFKSSNGDLIRFKIIIDQDQFKIFLKDNDQYFILFEKKDIPNLMNLLLEIQDV